MTLLAQHDRIRRDLAGCYLLGRRLLAGDAVEREFDLALARLRSDFTEHARAEGALLAQLLIRHSQRCATRGPLIAERMVVKHHAQHEAFWQLLNGPHREVASNLGDVMQQLDAHMAAEERTFLGLGIPGPRAHQLRA